MNRNFLLAFNIVLLILVGVLFYLHFSGSKKGTPPPVTVQGNTSTAGARIGYFVMDSIEKNYNYLQDVRNELKARENQLSGQLNSMKSRYMDKVNKFQQEAQTMTQERQGAMQQDLLNEQKVIQNKEQAISGELQNESFEKMQKVNKTIEDFLKEFNKTKGYNYILGYQEGTIYYKDTTFDVTNEVVKGLNDSYKKKG